MKQSSFTFFPEFLKKGNHLPFIYFLGELDERIMNIQDSILEQNPILEFSPPDLVSSYQTLEEIPDGMLSCYVVIPNIEPINCVAFIWSYLHSKESLRYKVNEQKYPTIFKGEFMGISRKGLIVLRDNESDISFASNHYHKRSSNL